MKKFLALMVLMVCAGCTTDRPVITPINGHSSVQTTHRFIGIPVWTSEDEVRTAKQAREKIELDKEKAEAELDLKTEERQAAAVFWFGAACFLAAVGCVVAGYFFHGWKFWGGMAAGAVGLGSFAWGFEHLLPYLKWPAGALIVICVLWSMWKLKDFSGAQLTKEKLAELAANRKKSKEGVDG